MSSKRVNPALSSVRFEWRSFQYLFSLEMCLFFHVKENEILVEYTYSFLRLLIILTLPNLDFITAHSRFIIAQMGSVTPLF